MKVSPSASPKAGTGSAVILCVERDPFVRDLGSFFLTEAGFGVTFPDDGLQALERARPAITGSLDASVDFEITCAGSPATAKGIAFGTWSLDNSQMNVVQSGAGLAIDCASSGGRSLCGPGRDH